LKLKENIKGEAQSIGWDRFCVYVILQECATLQLTWDDGSTFFLTLSLKRKGSCGMIAREDLKLIGEKLKHNATLIQAQNPF
jgi:hypothetical protein